MQRILPLVIALATGLAALAIIGVYYFERPTSLRVAVPRGSDSQKLLSALNQEFIRNHAEIRFRFVLTNDARAAAKSMEDGGVDLAVVRSDIVMPTDAQTVLILAHQYAVIAAPPGASYANVADLKDKRVAIIASDETDAGQTLLDTIETQYSLPREAIGRRTVDLPDLDKLMRAGEVDAVLAFGRFDFALVGRSRSSFIARRNAGRGARFCPDSRIQRHSQEISWPRGYRNFKGRVWRLTLAAFREYRDRRRDDSSRGPK